MLPHIQLEDKVALPLDLYAYQNIEKTYTKQGQEISQAEPETKTFVRTTQFQGKIGNETVKFQILG